MFILLLTGSGLCAEETGTIGGTVTNPFGDPAIGAQVMVLDSGVTALTMVRSMNGSYQLSDVPPGSCAILYTCTGFDSLLVEGVPVGSDSTTLLSVLLFWSPDGQRLDTVAFFDEPETVEDSVSVEEPTAGGRQK